MRIVLGSANKDKLKIVKKTLEELHLNIIVEGIKVDSGTSSQPMNKKVTKKGALYRATKAMKQKPDSDFWIGLEGGLHDYGEGYHLVTYACLIDQTGKKYYGEGEEIHLPQEVSKRVQKGEWFGKVIREYAKDHDINKELVTRLSPFTQAVQNAYAEYLKGTHDLGYREKAAGIVVDDSSNFLIVQLINYDEDDWNFSGGGIEPGENAEAAILRELQEELGTNNFKLVKKSKHSTQYEWSNSVIARRLKEKGSTFRGQNMQYFLVRFKGERENIKPDLSEIRNIKWVNKTELKNHLNFPDQWKATKVVLKDLL